MKRSIYTLAAPLLFPSLAAAAPPLLPTDMPAPGEYVIATDVVYSRSKSRGWDTRDQAISGANSSLVTRVDFHQGLSSRLSANLSLPYVDHARTTTRYNKENGGSVAYLTDVSGGDDAELALHLLISAAPHPGVLSLQLSLPSGNTRVPVPQIVDDGSIVQEKIDGGPASDDKDFRVSYAVSEKTKYVSRSAIIGFTRKGNGVSGDGLFLRPGESVDAAVFSYIDFTDWATLEAGLQGRYTWGGEDAQTRSTSYYSLAVYAGIAVRPLANLLIRPYLTMGEDFSRVSVVKVTGQEVTEDNHATSQAGIEISLAL